MAAPGPLEAEGGCWEVAVFLGKTIRVVDPGGLLLISASGSPHWLGDAGRYLEDS